MSLLHYFGRNVCVPSPVFVVDIPTEMWWCEEVSSLRGDLTMPHPALELPASGTVSNTFLLFTSLSGHGILFQFPEWTKTIILQMRKQSQKGYITFTKPPKYHPSVQGFRAKRWRTKAAWNKYTPLPLSETVQRTPVKARLTSVPAGPWGD